ncbi:MAG: hypothetical protein KF774_03520 [Planctomyces sp.]|nr:hypothetical protein [Planctomyces sp.]
MWTGPTGLGVALWLSACGLSEQAPKASPKSEEPAAGEPAADSKSAIDDEPQPTELTTETPAVVELKLSEEQQADILERLAKPRPQTVRLTLTDIVPVGGKPPSGAIRIFLGEGDEAVTAKTSVRDPRYAGTVVFQPAHGEEPQSFVLDVAPVLAELRRRERVALDKPIRLQLLLIPIEGDDPPRPVTLKSATLSVPEPR